MGNGWGVELVVVKMIGGAGNAMAPLGVGLGVKVGVGVKVGTAVGMTVDVGAEVGMGV
jgi:hypothetical protein